MFVGSKATISRDLIFGGSFAYLRHSFFPQILQTKEQQTQKNSISSCQYQQFVNNMLSAICSTILSSPLNYVRNIHYATSPNLSPDPIILVLKKLVHGVQKEQTWKQKWIYLQRSLRIGWGTARVGTGMAFGSFVYELCSKIHWN